MKKKMAELKKKAKGISDEETEQVSISQTSLQTDFTGANYLLCNFYFRNFYAQTCTKLFYL